MPSATQIVLLCSLAMVISYVDRVNISVAALAMQQTFDWTESVKGLVLAAFFLGYMVMQIFGGWLAHRMGGERVLVWALIGWSFFTLLTPVAAHLWLPLLVLVRIALGASEGPCNPASYNLIGRWVPEQHRTTAVGVYGSAGFLGSFVALAVTGPLVTRFGWEFAFYLFGVLGLVYAALCYPTLERLRRHGRTLAAGKSPDDLQAARAIPWKRLLGMRAFWALVLSFFSTSWLYYMLLLWMPSYFSRTHGLEISKSGIYSLAPWLIMCVVMNVAGWLSDVIARRGVSATTIRKVLASAGLFGAGVGLIVVQSAATALGAMTILCMALAALALTYASLAPNVFDLAPRYGEVLFAVLNTFGSLPGVIGVALTGLLTQLTGSFNAALTVSAVLAMLGAVVFMLFGSGQRQVD